MRTKKLRFIEELSHGQSLEDSIPELSSGGGSLYDDRLVRAALKVAMYQDLTARQRECITMYFMEQLTMEQIGERLGIGKSTVCKHIKTGKEHIRRVLSYAEAFRKAMEEDGE